MNGIRMMSLLKLCIGEVLEKGRNLGGRNLWRWKMGTGQIVIKGKAVKRWFRVTGKIWGAVGFQSRRAIWWGIGMTVHNDLSPSRGKGPEFQCHWQTLHPGLEGQARPCSAPSSNVPRSRPVNAGDLISSFDLVDDGSDSSFLSSLQSGDEEEISEC